MKKKYFVSKKDYFFPIVVLSPWLILWAYYYIKTYNERIEARHLREKLENTAGKIFNTEQIKESQK